MTRDEILEGLQAARDRGKLIDEMLERVQWCLTSDEGADWSKADAGIALAVEEVELFSKGELALAAIQRAVGARAVDGAAPVDREEIDVIDEPVINANGTRLRMLRPKREGE